MSEGYRWNYIAEEILKSSSIWQTNNFILWLMQFSPFSLTKLSRFSIYWFLSLLAIMSLYDKLTPNYFLLLFCPTDRPCMHVSCVLARSVCGSMCLALSNRTLSLSEKTSINFYSSLSFFLCAIRSENAERRRFGLASLFVGSRREWKMHSRAKKSYLMNRSKMCNVELKHQSSSNVF